MSRAQGPGAGSGAMAQYETGDGDWGPLADRLADHGEESGCLLGVVEVFRG